MSSKYDTTKWSKYLMRINGLSVGINMPKALPSIGSGESEAVHRLPAYHRKRCWLVDEYPACPADWMRSSGRIKSYFVPIIEGNGMWLDFNNCLDDIQQHVAIVVSIQGVNAVTGLPAKDAQLEQYRDSCPKHKTSFGADRFCKQCGYKWPKQNYIASTGTPDGALWLDGFRTAEDGVIRQYVLTAQTARGVAKSIIGEERVSAIGISFFLSKEKRPQPAPTITRKSCFGLTGPTGHAGATGVLGFAPMSDTLWDSMATDYSHVEPASNFYKYSSGTNEIPPGPPVTYTCSAKPEMMSRCVGEAKGGTAKYDAVLRGRKFAALNDSPAVNSVVLAKQPEIAAGAKIDQRVYDDPYGLDYWQSEPEGIIVINYCLESEAEAIIAAGKIDVSGSQEGFLKNVPVGNPA